MKNWHNKVLFHEVKGFPDVNLKSHIAPSTLTVHDIETLRGCNNAIFNIPTLNKTKLVNKNNMSGNKTI